MVESKINSVSFSPDGSLFVFANRDSIWIYNVPSIELTSEIGKHDLYNGFSLNMRLENSKGLIRSMAFSPDNNLLAGTIKEEAVWVLDIDSKKYILEESIEDLLSLTFSPNSNSLAISGRNQPIRIWTELHEGRPTEWLRIPQRENVHSMVFRPDGQQLASASNDGILLITPVQEEALLKEAMKRIHRNFTQEEWKFYFGDEPYHCIIPELQDYN